jgi:hypothetical protein
VRALLDESLPRDLAPATREQAPGHEIRTVREEHWTGHKNGALLRAAREADFAVLVTADRQMEHQQTIATSGLALVVLRARSTRLDDLLPLLPPLVALLPTLRAGQVAHVDG